MRLYFIPILMLKDKNFVYPKSYLSDDAETAIRSVLNGFEIFKVNFEDGILIVQAELDQRGKMIILEEEDKVKEQIGDYLYVSFEEDRTFSFPYFYRKIKYRFSLIFLDIEI